jgi:iduronate 2-sulfatase
MRHHPARMLVILLTAIVSDTTPAPGQGPPPTQSAPNLVFLYVDDLNTDIDLPSVGTPNIDLLADRGVRFTSAYASHSVCNPSRVSLLSGQRTNHTQVVFNSYAPPSPEINGVPFLPCLLRDAGYYTVKSGKVFHFGQPACWEEFYSFADDPWIEKPSPPGGTGFVPLIFGGPFENGPDGSLGKMEDTKSTDKALQLLEEARSRLDATGQPFAVWLGLRATHNGFIYPERFLADYTESDVHPLPIEETTEDWKDDVNQASYFTPWTYVETWGATEEERRVQARLAYFRCIAFVDEQIGRVLDELVTLQLESSTVVVLVSDHGVSFSEHSHVSKTRGFDEDIRAPLVLAVPDLVETYGQVINKPVEHVDLYPTITQLLGIETPAGLDGRSLVPLLQDPQLPHKPAFYTTEEDFAFNLTRYVVAKDAVTGEHWKLGAWENDDQIPQVHQLYNLTTDPGEYDNLYTDPMLAHKVIELRAYLTGVDLLGPGWRNYGSGLAGTLGVPSLTGNGPPVLGEPVSVDIGNSSGVATLGAALIGLSGVYPGSPGSTSFTVQAQIVRFVSIPANGLSVPFSLPSGPAFHELPLGIQVLQIDPGAPGGVSISRALAVLLSE